MLGFSMSYLKGMRIAMFRLSGLYCRKPENSKLNPINSSILKKYNPIFRFASSGFSRTEKVARVQEAPRRPLFFVCVLALKDSSFGRCHVSKSVFCVWGFVDGVQN